MIRRTSAALLLVLACLAPARAADDDTPPPPDLSDVLDALLAGLGGFKEMSPAELEQEVAEVGGVPFRSPVTFEFMDRPALARYVHELLDDEYDAAHAQADQRTLSAFGLIDRQADLRGMRARLLEQNVAGFYDVRPGHKRMYAISSNQRLTPANQLVLSHELRHALQDQYVDVHGVLPDTVGDFDDRSLATLSLLEGDALLVMERFLTRRIGNGDEGLAFDPSGLSLPAGAVLPDTPPILRDQLMLPYTLGRSFAVAVHARGGWSALRTAWSSPPRSSEQVIHPEKYFAGEAPRVLDPVPAPAGAKPVGDGVLGEAFIGTLLGEGGEAAAAGWGGDRYQAWDVGGRTVLVWRSVWDTEADAIEFRAALEVALHRRGQPRPALMGFQVVVAAPWTIAWRSEADGTITYVSADDEPALASVLRARVAAAR